MREHEGEPAAEDEPPSAYIQIARFAHETIAGLAFTQAQKLLFDNPCELSAYRLLFSRVWHVAVVGQQPPEDLHQQLERILSTGEPASLPDELIQLLQERGVQARRRGPWSEEHYHGGRLP